MSGYSFANQNCSTGINRYFVIKALVWWRIFLIPIPRLDCFYFLSTLVDNFYSRDNSRTIIIFNRYLSSLSLGVDSFAYHSFHISPQSLEQSWSFIPYFLFRKGIPHTSKFFSSAFTLIYPLRLSGIIAFLGMNWLKISSQDILHISHTLSFKL